jgi:hypothetical protein
MGVFARLQQSRTFYMRKVCIWQFLIWETVYLIHNYCSDIYLNHIYKWQQSLLPDTVKNLWQLKQYEHMSIRISSHYSEIWWSMWWCSWLRYCATNQKAAGSIPNGVTGIFHWHNPFGRTMALGLIQPLTEMSTRNISWAVKAAGS